MQNETKIKCPNCGTEIDVQNVLTHQLEDQIKRSYDAKLHAEKQKMEAQYKALESAKAEFEEKKKRENELYQEKIDAKLKVEKNRLIDKIKAKYEEEQFDAIKALQKELNEKTEQVKELYLSKAEIERLKREKAELKEAVEADFQKKLNHQLAEEKEKIRLNEQEKNELRIKELNKQLEDQKRLTEEMKRKQEQGSMQMQGEVQELAIEEWLASKFPLDTIEEIKKGARGGDCIQVVHTRNRQNCGSIYYESKRTKDFQASWVEKFKNDIRDRGADIGVLVTEAMPLGMERMGLKDGIWICTYEEFKALCFVLRQSVISVSNAIGSQENKGEKMQILYDYLTSNKFKMQFDAIVEGFKQMKADLDSEKRSTLSIWKKREAQIEKVLLNTGDIYGSLRGIAGNAIQPVPTFELPEPELSDEEYL